MIWTLPEEDSDFSTRWQLIKRNFTLRYRHKCYSLRQACSSQVDKCDVWQKRFWEHLIRNETGLARHIEYIHFNPVKHGYVQSPGVWKYSSFMRFVKEGIYPIDWAGDKALWEQNIMEE